MMKPILLALCSLVPALTLPAHALDADANAPASAQPVLQSDYVPRESSILSHLQLRPGQVERLSRLYDDYAARRSEHQEKISLWQGQLTTAQQDGDERAATRLARDINDARREVEDDFLSARGKALKTLTRVQRAQLQSVASDPRIKIRRDKYFQLLLMPAHNIWQAPLLHEPAASSTLNPAQPNRSYPDRSYPDRRYPDRRYPGRSRGRRARSAGGSYGVYGGYGYRQPQYGVYGNYGQGPVGVHAGIGRGGPSVGIGVGGVFGGFLRLR